MMFKSIIIDDEANARSRIKRLLLNYTNIIEVIAEASNGFQALEQIESLKPDLIFLDIQMPGLDGFELVKRLKFLPVIVFTTAYDQYALKAFETNTIDYLVKPIEAERLDITIQKLQRLNKNEQEDNIRKFIQLAEKLKPQNELTSLSVKIGDKILLIRLSEIVYFEADEKYVTIQTYEKGKYITDLTLKILEDKLPTNFVRVQRAFIVNKNYVLELNKQFGGKYVIVMNDKDRTRILTGTTYKEKLVSYFDL
ncbi:MAG TPA: response regulator [Bacteroidales bacterium]